MSRGWLARSTDARDLIFLEGMGTRKNSNFGRVMGRKASYAIYTVKVSGEP